MNYLPNAVSLSVLVTGDFNHDGLVNSADFVVWRKNNGSVADYNAWRASFGNALGSGSSLPARSSNSANVPEPAPTVLLAMGVAFVWLSRPRLSSNGPTYEVAGKFINRLLRQLA